MTGTTSIAVVVACRHAAKSIYPVTDGYYEDKLRRTRKPGDTAMTQPESTESDTSEPVFGLRWGIKRTFIDYISRMSDGKGSVSGGATPVGVNEVLFAPDTTGRRPGADGGEERFWAFRGDVRFSGHFGLLFVRVAAPTVTLRGAEAELTVDDPYNEDNPERLLLATLRLEQQPASEDIEIWQGSDVRLAETGTELFNNSYPPGEPFEPLTLTLPIVP